MSEGTARGESTRLAAGRPHAAEAAGTRMHPYRVRVAATLGADVVALLAAALLAVWFAGVLDDVPVLGRVVRPFEADPHHGTLTFVLLIPIWLAALWAFGLYRDPGRSIGGMGLSESLSGLTALTCTAWAVLILMFLIDGLGAPVPGLIAFWALAAVFVPAARGVTKATVWSRTSFKERALIIGAGDVGHMIAGKIAKHPGYHVKLVGFLDDGEPRHNGDGGPKVPVIGALSDLQRIIAEEQIDRVIVAFSRARHNDFLRVVRACADTGVQVNIVPRLFEVVSSRALVDDVEGIPLLDVGHVELGRFNMGVKRTFDLLVGGVIFVLSLPLMAAVAVAIKLDSRGPVFFKQERMGRGGRTFLMYKFRSMYVGAERHRENLAAQNEYSGPMFKLHDDPRVTRIGGWLRRWSIDEVPQIINVMRGDMSLVGPRPLWVEEAKQCRGWTQKRLDITPGMTGLWQVLGRSDIPFDEMVKLDYMYVTGWSLSWDIKLLVQTVGAVVEKRGAY